ncbi:hypothetical protein [Nostoc sp. 'Peltigera membranacea cyanobiont' 210A]|uniref:hypothetical protein n=1 Tax=Nostoc sp. 'Peltigera membranacea cyanobiont' 210A TaxID=2014529 RepID=UPI001CB9C46C|nr:hypothetical protein [Nostoc sp. 'Peltigera membranacea cyanobiont' 210A]
MNKLQFISLSILGVVVAVFLSSFNPAYPNISPADISIIQPVKAANKVAFDLRNFVDNLPEGQVAHNIPSTMILQESYSVKVNIAKGISADIARDFSSEVEVQSLKVHTLMKIDLVGNNFEIQPVAEQNQIIDNSGIAQWEWNIIPKGIGKKELYIIIYARIKLPDGSQENHRLKTIKKSVNVITNLQVFVSQNSKWFFEMVIPLFLAIIITASNFNRLKQCIVSIFNYFRGGGSGGSTP